MSDYYTACVRRGGQWEPEFGDYDTECVEFEADDLRAKGERVRIIRTGDTQPEIDAGVARLNRQQV